MTLPIDPLVVKIISDIDTPYTSCYCEENIYLASQRLILAAHEALEAVYVVFISNLKQTALLWEQRASQHPAELGSSVIWDYHVIMILVASSRRVKNPLLDRAYVVDFDSSLGKLTSWKEYTSKTFKPELFKNATFKADLQSMFRVISATHFINQFASDRSHMKDTKAKGPIKYKMPPPPYKPIVGPDASAKGVTNNLMTDYVSMAVEGAPNSVVLSMDAFLDLGWSSMA